MLKNLELYLSSDIKFIEKSKYEVANTSRKNGNKYPIGVLQDEIEIHFLHYTTAEEAKIKWNRRLQRLNMDNLFISFTDRDLCDPEHINEFDRLPFKHKVCFVAKEYPNNKSVIWLKGYSKDSCIGDIYSNSKEYKKHFDVAEWLNGTVEKSKTDSSFL